MSEIYDEYGNIAIKVSSGVYRGPDDMIDLVISFTPEDGHEYEEALREAEVFKVKHNLRPNYHTVEKSWIDKCMGSARIHTRFKKSEYMFPNQSSKQMLYLVICVATDRGIKCVNTIREGVEPAK